MATPLPRILQPLIVNERVNRLNVINDTFQRAFGMQKGGSAVRTQPVRRGIYDIFDSTRQIASANHPGTEAKTIARFPVGSVPYVIPRTAEKMPIPIEELNQLRPIGGPATTIDVGGEQYLLDQETNMKQTLTNLREFQIAAMLRGSYGWTANGSDGFTHAFTGGTITINFLIPAGNLSQLDMLGAGDIIGTAWDNSAAPIIRDLFAINQAFSALCGLGLTDVWLNSTVWGFVITNTEVQNLGGTSSNPVKSLVRDEERNEFVGILEAAPWVTFHITDNGLDVGGTFTRLLADTQATFTCRMTSEIVSYYECPEPVVNPTNNKLTHEVGEYYYYKMIDDPVVVELHTRFNGLPVVKIPKAIATGTVDF